MKRRITLPRLIFSRSGPLLNPRQYQGGWIQLVLFIVSTLISIALAPKPPTPKPAALEDFEFPVAEEGRPIPVVFGEVEISGANVLWYGDLSKTKIKKSGLFGSTTVGYKYFIGFHAGLCYGTVDALKRVRIDEKVAWSGNLTAPGSVVIDVPTLFGKVKEQGGVSGTLEVQFGEATQVASPYLVAKMPGAVPAHRDILSIIWRNAGGTGGGYIGNSEYVKPWAVLVARTTAGWQGGTAWYPTKIAPVAGSMNPVHVIYQCLTDQEWGMGLPASSLDDAAWRAAADTVFTEGMGVRLLWNQQTQIEEFIATVQEHVNGQLGMNPSTGLLELRLVRGDYDPNTLVIFDESTIVRMDSFQRQGWGETVNEITVKFTDPDTFKPASVTVHDLANIRSQGLVEETVNLPAFYSRELAQLAAMRELQARSTPLAKLRFHVSRAAWDKYGNAVIKVTWPKRNIVAMIVRVLKVRRGLLVDSTMEIEGIEDIFAVSPPAYTVANVPVADAAPPAPQADDDAVGGNILSSTTTTPPGAPVDGDRYFIPVGATGVWAFNIGKVATWDAALATWAYETVANGTVVNNTGAATYQTLNPNGTTSAAPWSGGGASPLLVKGDLFTFDTASQRLPVGTNDTVLTADSLQTTGLAWRRPQVGQAASAARVTRNSVQTIATATATAVLWTTEDFDDENYWVVGTADRLTAPRDGKYLVTAVVQWDSSMTGTRDLRIVLNGTTIMAFRSNPAAAGLVQHIATVLKLVSGDYVTVVVVQDSGVSVNLVTATAMPQVTISRIGALTVPTLIRGATWVRGVGAITFPVNDVALYVPKKSVIRGVAITTNGGIGSCVVDIWKDAVANYPPTVADSITASAKPTIVSARTVVNTTLTGWITALAAGDVLMFHLDSTSTFTAIFVTLFIEEVE